jgi:hypothetical protein
VSKRRLLNLIFFAAFGFFSYWRGALAMFLASFAVIVVTYVSVGALTLAWLKRGSR